MPYVFTADNSPVLDHQITVQEVVYPVANFPLMNVEELNAIGVKWVEPAVIDAGSLVTPDLVRLECARRIYAVASVNTQSNLNAHMNILSFKDTLTDADTADVALFRQAMAWIEAMRANVAQLVGNVDYRNDEKWPPLTDELRAFAARF